MVPRPSDGRRRSQRPTVDPTGAQNTRSRSSVVGWFDYRDRFDRSGATPGRRNLGVSLWSDRASLLNGRLGATRRYWIEFEVHWRDTRRTQRRDRRSAITSGQDVFTHARSGGSACPHHDKADPLDRYRFGGGRGRHPSEVCDPSDRTLRQTKVSPTEPHAG